MSITSPANGATFTPGSSITIQASAADKLLSTSPTNDGQVARVSFVYKVSPSSTYTLITTDTTSPYSGTISNAAAGSYTLVATAYDSAGNAMNSATRSISVTTMNPAALTINTIPAKGPSKQVTISGSLTDSATNIGIAGKSITFTGTDGYHCSPYIGNYLF